MTARPFEIDGSIFDNLRAVTQSARRFRGRRVYKETLQYWRDLIAFAKAERPKYSADASEAIGELLSECEAALREFEAS